MTTETTPNGSFDATAAMMGILSDESQEVDESQAKTDDEAIATDEVDDEAESEEEVDEGDDEPAPVAKTFKVKIDGEEVEVPEDELLKGYSRTQDYTRKTQQLAEQRKAAEQEYESVRNERAQYAQLLGQLSAKLADEPQIDESLQYTDPIAYAKQLSQVFQYQQNRQAVEQEQQRLNSLQQHEQQQQMQKYLADQQEALASLIPEWLDKDVAKAEKVKVRETGKAYGYSDEELSQLYDARAVALMRDAMKYRDLVAKRQEVKPKATPVVNARPKTVGSEQSKIKTRLAKSGSVQDAVAYFKTLL